MFELFDPAHPGELLKSYIIGLREETGLPYTIEEVAQNLGTTRKTLSAILNKRQSVTSDMAIRLAAAFPNSTPEFWLQVQEGYDLAASRRTVNTSKIKALWPVSSAISASA
jgi:addiction module HigA family antidote